MKELWTKEEAEYHGSYYDFPAGEIIPQTCSETPSSGILGRQGAKRL